MHKVVLFAFFIIAMLLQSTSAGISAGRDTRPSDIRSHKHAPIRHSARATRRQYKRDTADIQTLISQQQVNALEKEAQRIIAKGPELEAEQQQLQSEITKGLRPLNDLTTHDFFRSSDQDQEDINRRMKELMGELPEDEDTDQDDADLQLKQLMEEMSDEPGKVQDPDLDELERQLSSM